MFKKVDIKHILPIFEMSENTEGLDSFKDLPDQAIIITKNGLKIFKRTFMYCSLSDYTWSDSQIGEYKGKTSHFLLTKLPADCFILAMDFLKNVLDRKKSEGNILIYMKTDTNDFQMLIPEQKVSHGSVDYKMPDPKDIPEGYKLVGSIHSHPTFSAFQSGTDHADEQNVFEGFHITCGYINRVNPEFHARINMTGKTETVSWKDVVDVEGLPKEWLEFKKPETSSAGKQIGFHSQLQGDEYDWMYEDYGAGKTGPTQEYLQDFYAPSSAKPKDDKTKTEGVFKIAIFTGAKDKTWNFKEIGK